MEHLIVGLVAGLAATPHCVGMCGGFALHLARDGPPKGVLYREFSFLLGKAFTYTFIGALVGAFGLWVVDAGWVPVARRNLVYGAAAITIVIGFLMLELPVTARLPRVRWPGVDFLQGHASRLLQAPCALGTFAFGLAVGFLPCPLTVGLAIVAAGESSVSAGMLLLGGAGLGTMPGLVATGLFGSTIRGKWRVVGTKALGVVVILLGTAMLLRKFGVLPGGHAGACH